ncbi:hypothetical protein MIR68_001094 [Amoeboaphelidium protococcarum]|nr:hypothetical protein MIR68_001094 [Amoeboaphelidium protococcarum]
MTLAFQNLIRQELAKSKYASKSVERLMSSLNGQQENALVNLHLFLKSNREYHELQQKYHPTTNATELHKIKLSAQRVGLELPNNFKSMIGEE